MKYNQLMTASKIVFILVALTVCVTYFLGRLESKDFIPLVTMVFAYYFTRSPANGHGKDY